MVCGNGDGSGGIGVSEGDGIETTGRERVAPSEPTEGQPGTLEKTETNQGDVRIFGTGRQIKALAGTEGMEDRRQDGFVEEVSDADAKTGLRVFHRLTTLAGVFHGSFQQPFGWHGRRRRLHARGWESRGR